VVEAQSAGGVSQARETVISDLSRNLSVMLEPYSCRHCHLLCE